MQERRRFPRQAVHKRAKVLLNRDKTPLDCIVFDLTNHGAGIQLPFNMSVPMSFELSFDNFRSTRDCRVAWQNRDKLGACFL